MSVNDSRRAVLPRVPAWPLLWLGRAMDRLWEWRRRHRSRHQLKKFSEHMCKDIGISTADAWRESSKPFWKP